MTLELCDKIYNEASLCLNKKSLYAISASIILHASIIASSPINIKYLV
jgi:hypothetical protein